MFRGGGGGALASNAATAGLFGAGAPATSAAAPFGFSGESRAPAAEAQPPGQPSAFQDEPLQASAFEDELLQASALEHELLQASELCGAFLESLTIPNEFDRWASSSSQLDNQQENSATSDQKYIYSSDNDKDDDDDDKSDPVGKNREVSSDHHRSENDQREREDQPAGSLNEHLTPNSSQSGVKVHGISSPWNADSAPSARSTRKKKKKKKKKKKTKETKEEEEEEKKTTKEKILKRESARTERASKVGQKAARSHHSSTKSKPLIAQPSSPMTQRLPNSLSRRQRSRSGPPAAASFPRSRGRASGHLEEDRKEVIAAIAVKEAAPTARSVRDAGGTSLHAGFEANEAASTPIRWGTAERAVNRSRRSPTTSNLSTRELNGVHPALTTPPPSPTALSTRPVAEIGAHGGGPRKGWSDEGSVLPRPSSSSPCLPKDKGSDTFESPVFSELASLESSSDDDISLQSSAASEDDLYDIVGTAATGVDTGVEPGWGLVYPRLSASPASATAAAQRDLVQFSVAAPAAVKRGQVFRINVFVTKAVEALVQALVARLADEGREVVGAVRPEAMLPHGAKVVTHVEVFQCTVTPMTDTVVWCGRETMTKHYVDVGAKYADVDDLVRGVVTITCKTNDSILVGPLTLHFTIALESSTTRGLAMVKMLGRWVHKLRACGFDNSPMHEWSLPRELSNFTPLCKSPAVLGLVHSVHTSQEHLERAAEATVGGCASTAAVGGSAALRHLREINRALLSADTEALRSHVLQVAIQRLQSPTAVAEIKAVASQGLEAFKPCYEAIWRFIQGTEADGMAIYQSMVASLPVVASCDFVDGPHATEGSESSRLPQNKHIAQPTQHVIALYEEGQSAQLRCLAVSFWLPHLGNQGGPYATVWGSKFCGNQFRFMLESSGRYPTEVSFANKVPPFLFTCVSG
jgi:site-specific DNA-cytosine methylase